MADPERFFDFRTRLDIERAIIAIALVALHHALGAVSPAFGSWTGGLCTVCVVMDVNRREPCRVRPKRGLPRSGPLRRFRPSVGALQERLQPRSMLAWRDAPPR